MTPTTILIFIFCDVAIIILLGLFIVIIDAIILGHTLPTSSPVVQRVQEIITQHTPTPKKFYDLGCAHGAFARNIQRVFPALEVRAVDNNIVRICFARIQAFLCKSRAMFIRSNIFEINLRDTDIVYTYLWYSVMPSLEQKLRKELKPGAIVITNTSHFPNWKPIQTIITHEKLCETLDFETLFVYRQE